MALEEVMANNQFNESGGRNGNVGVSYLEEYLA